MIYKKTNLQYHCCVDSVTPSQNGRRGNLNKHAKNSARKYANVSKIEF